MKKKFQGQISKADSHYSDIPFSVVCHEKYRCFEYKTRMNLFTFGRRRLDIPVTVVGMPASVDRPGFSGDISALVEDYGRRKGINLVLNILPGSEASRMGEDKRGFLNVAFGETLSTCIFDNSFAFFEDYVKSLRSGYRRRVRAALKKGRPLTLRKVPPEEYDEGLHKLYLQVVEQSKYPLERLKKEFFQEVPCEILAFYAGQKPAAFAAVSFEAEEGALRRPSAAFATVSIEAEEDALREPSAAFATVSIEAEEDALREPSAEGEAAAGEKRTLSCNFLFGGLDYSLRDEYDLYYNLLLQVIRRGIEEGAGTINLGQTAEHTKCRLGCRLEKRYMLAFSGNPVLNLLLKAAAPLLAYTPPEIAYRVFRF